MGKTVELTTSDGHRLDAYVAEPAQPGKGSIVVIQEIFGVNNHIRNVCDRFAAEGYRAIAPALFDRQQRGFECGYTPADMHKAFAMVVDPQIRLYLLDAAAAIEYAQTEGPVSIVGFCLGGSVAYGSAATIPGLASAVCYYGGHIKFLMDQPPMCPTLMHFGSQDEHIPLEDIQRIQQARGADATIHIYEGAEHGFNCDERSSFNEAASKLAWSRTLEWIERAHSKA